MVIVTVVYSFAIGAIAFWMGFYYHKTALRSIEYCVKCGRENNPLSMKMKCMSGKVVSCCNICYALYMPEIQKYRVEN